jgi:molecular chaperone GrpE (heat shock protein)
MNKDHPDQAEAACGESFQIRLDPVDLLPRVADAPAAPTTAAAAKQAADTVARLDDLADDLTDVLQGLKLLREANGQLQERMQGVEQTLSGGLRSYARELDQLRTELLGEAKVAVTKQAFGAVLISTDQLQAMRSGLEPSDERLALQLDAVLSVLKTTLRNLGYEAFEAEAGSKFDPNRMEISGYEPGPAGAVVRTTRLGYQHGSKLARVCGVTLGGEG